MNHFNKQCLEINSKKHLNSQDFANWMKYLLKVGAASGLTLSTCAVEFNGTNYHYTDVVVNQDFTKFNLSNYIASRPLEIDTIIEDEEHEIAYEASNLENLNIVPPVKSFRTKGRINSITKGFPSKV